MGYKKQLTHAEHLILAARVRDAHRVLDDIYLAVHNNMGSTHRASKLLCKTLANFDLARSVLDSAYHSVTSAEQFAQHGHVYYGGKPNE